MKNIICFALCLFPVIALALPFTDGELNRVMRNHPRGLIYVWSPHMPLSVQGLPEARALAKEMGLAFTAVVDAHAAAPAGDWTLASPKLLRLGVANHYPAMVIHRHGRLLPHYVQGYEPPAGLRRYLSDILQDRMGGQGRDKNAVPVATLVPGLFPKAVTRAFPLDGVINYFFKVAPDAHHLAYNLGSNYLMRLDTGATTRVPGPFDPVFTPDSAGMVLISSGFSLYTIDDLWRDGSSTQPRYSDHEIGGVYHSTGDLGLIDGVPHFRMITESGGSHSLRDYAWDPARTVAAPRGAVRGICSNYQLKLPMLSKDGKEVGGIDLANRMSALWRINDDGTCTKVLDINLRTGKMNFSHDGKLVTFHIFSNGNDGYVNRPKGVYTADIYLLDRATREVRRLTAHPDANDLYPDFTLDGQLVWAHYPHNQEKTVFRFAGP